ncbi:MAG: MarR family transcriptional regulator [Clostridia bacterium]|nr:MarR family transcriptional regulator [Clostridia bacterium]MBR6754146.1 MarR family transcriptional regulator [Clostridia bacterium]
METKGGYLISRIKQVGTRIFDRMLAQSGIDSFNGAQGRILYVLWQQDGITISSLSAKTSLANTTLTAMLDRMEMLGLIVRKPDPADRRSRLIALTEKARSLQGDYANISQQMNERYYAGFTEEEIVVFEGYLQRVLSNLEREEQKDE